MAEAGAADFEQLQVAHDRLTGLYTTIHRQVERRILLRPAVDEHLRRGVQLLRNEYIQAAETRFTSDREQKWLDQEIGRLQNLYTTFNYRWIPAGLPNTVQSIIGFPGVGVILSAAGLSAAGLAISGVCLCNLLWIVPGLIMTILLLVGVTSLDDTVTLLDEKEVPAAEGAVFGLLGTERPKLQHWPRILAVIALSWTVAAVLEELAIHRHAFVNPHHNRYWIFAGLSILIALGVYVASRRR